MLPDSNQQSKTSGILFINPPHFSHLKVISSTICLCKSSTFLPDNFSNSVILPMVLILPQPLLALGSKLLALSSKPSWHCQTGIGVPQYRWREIDQSEAFSSHLPNRPSFKCAGVQWTLRLFLIKFSLIAVTLTNQEVVA